MGALFSTPDARTPPPPPPPPPSASPPTYADPKVQAGRAAAQARSRAVAAMGAASGAESLAPSAPAQKQLLGQ